ncbi:9888_t:CDS:1, partial [Ambispora leptoticha]
DFTVVIEQILSKYRTHTTVACPNQAIDFRSDYVIKSDDLNLNDILKKVLERGISQAKSLEISQATDLDLKVIWEKVFNEFGIVQKLQTGADENQQLQTKADESRYSSLIRAHINLVDYYREVKPYAKILQETLYEDLLNTITKLDNTCTVYDYQT